MQTSQPAPSIDPRTLPQCREYVQDALMDAKAVAKSGYHHSEAVRFSTLDPSEK